MLEIPSHLLNDKTGLQLNLEPIKNKKVVGLIGYAGSGKDTIADCICKLYGYKKIKFADIVKQYMNQHLKEQIFKDLTNKGINLKKEDIDFFTEKREIKEVLRPYIIWFSETLRKENGVYYWINKSFENIKDLFVVDKFVIADVRRVDEIDLFKNENTQLIHINQFNLDDSDDLTKQALLKAMREWVINETVYIDSRIPYDLRKEYIENQVKNITIFK